MVHVQYLVVGRGKRFSEYGENKKTVKKEVIVHRDPFILFMSELSSLDKKTVMQSPPPIPPFMNWKLTERMAGVKSVLLLFPAP